MSDLGKLRELAKRNLPPELAQEAQLEADRQLYGFSVLGPDGERIDPESILPVAAEADPED